MKSRSRSYQEDPDNVFHFALSALRRIQRFIIERVDETNRKIYATTPISGFSWGEKIVIEIRSVSFHSVTVTVSSQPKLFTNIFAAGDAGKNVNDFFAALNAEMGVTGA
jgi:hypothetical protein